MRPIDFSLAELDAVRRQAAATDPGQCERFIDELQRAKRIFVSGAGRSLLVMRMFAMRLMQSNHVTYMVGEVCTPSLRPGDLLVASSGRGSTAVTHDLVRKAKKNGGRAALVTGNPGGAIAPDADFVLVIPPMPPAASDDPPAALFMKKHQWGNFYETASLIVLDGIIAGIMEREGVTDDVIMRNHANLE